MNTFSEAQRGKSILKKYRHPGSWVDGDMISQAQFRGQWVLLIKEIRRGPGATVSDMEARANARAIRAWAEYVGLPPGSLIIQNNQGQTPYLLVAKREWEQVVLPELKAL